MLIKLLCISLLLYSCSPKAIVGPIERVSGDTACLSKKCFLLFKKAPKAYEGQTATFTYTVNRRKLNCRVLKNY